MSIKRGKDQYQVELESVYQKAPGRGRIWNPQISYRNAPVQKMSQSYCFTNI